MKVVKAPEDYAVEESLPSVFLAGSIEMGTAENWQERIEKELESREGLILNPRRDDWNSSWEQSITNPNFRQQVEWELGALELVSHIFLYFSPGTKSPISLLEFGMYAESGKLVTCCPEGFWRKGNVEVVSAMYGVDLYDNLDDAIEELQNRVDHHQG